MPLGAQSVQLKSSGSEGELPRYAPRGTERFLPSVLPIAYGIQEGRCDVNTQDRILVIAVIGLPKMGWFSDFLIFIESIFIGTPLVHQFSTLPFQILILQLKVDQSKLQSAKPNIFSK
jgi:hypothetical protein